MQRNEIDNEPISETKSSKVLWVHIDDKLNWKMHIDYVSGTIAGGMWILIKSPKIFSNECINNMYYAFIYSYLIYCNHIWGNTYKTLYQNYNFYIVKLHVSQLGHHP